MIDVNDLIRTLSLSQLNEAADKYWQRLTDNPKLLAKPFNIGDAEHTFPQLGFVIQGLQLYVGMTVLDFGAGSCYASRILNQMGLRVISMDVSAAALQIGRGLREKFPPVGQAPEHLFTVFDGKRFDLPDASVDRIICLDAFHHVPDQEAVLSEMSRVLKEGGIAGFSEPGPHHSKTTEAQFEMRNSTVIENDIVLSQIRSNGYKHGFTDLRVVVAPIHPPLVPLDQLTEYSSRPAEFMNAVMERVTNFPIFFFYKGDPALRDSRNSVGLSCRITPSHGEIIAMAGQSINLTLDVINNSPKIWLASGDKTGSVNVGAMLRKVEVQGYSETKEYRFGLSLVDVTPGATLSGVLIDLGLLEPGEYQLEIDLVSEYVSWFQSLCESMVSIKVRVR